MSLKLSVRHVLTGNLSEDVFANLRHLMQSYPNISLLFAGVHTLEELGEDAENYFINTQAIEISYLESHEAKELIRNPDESIGLVPQYEDDVVDEILCLTNNHPYLIQAICSNIIQLANRDSLSTITLNVLNEAIERVFQQCINYFQFLRKLEKGNLDILTTLAQGKTFFTSEQTANEDTRQLILHRVIHKLEDGRYEIEVPLMQRWLQNQFELAD